jgi:hypothetical protein
MPIKAAIGDAITASTVISSLTLTCHARTESFRRRSLTGSSGDLNPVLALFAAISDLLYSPAAISP